MSHTNYDHTKFSVKARVKSFKYAINGIENFFDSELNAWIHLLATIVVIILAVVFNISGSETVALVLSIGFVWVSELFNTAIEKTMDFISADRSQKIRHIKDLSAAAVLVSAITALTIGCIIFIPKI